MSGGIELEGRSTNRLSDRAIKAFIANARAGKAAKGKLFDGGGLFLTVSDAGSALWRVKYRHNGKERLYAVGTYPEVGLASAREEREMVKLHLRAGRDPSAERRLSRAAATAASATAFASVANDWLDKQKPAWSDIHYQQSRRAFERDVLPLLGRLPIASITPAMVASVVTAVLGRGVRETASKLLWHIICVFDYAAAKGLCNDNPATPVRQLLPPRGKVSRRPASLDVKELREILGAADRASLSPAVRMAHRLTAFTAARVWTIVTAEWSEFHLERDVPMWIIPRSKLKVKDRESDHKVVLGPTIAAELKAWRSLIGDKGFLFKSPTGRAHITREALEKVYRVTLDLSGKHSMHGWRSSFSTLARDAGFPRDAVELALDHIADNATVRAYDRGERLKERIEVACWWDKILTEPRSAVTG